LDYSKEVLVVIPARNEEKTITSTLNALDFQTIPPKKVIIVDDGSKDNTVEILKNYKSRNYELIIKTRPERKSGKSVVGTPLLAETFNKGFQICSTFDYDYLLILGADIILEKRFIEKLLVEFSKDSSLAIASGQNILMVTNPMHARGAGRMIDYRFWKYYGERYPVIYGWEDDCLNQCRRIGLKVRHFAKIRYGSLRKAQGTIDFVNWGRAARAMRYHPVIAGMRAIRLSILQRYGIKALVRFIAGYLCSSPPETLTDSQRKNREFMRKFQLIQIPEKIIAIIENML